MWLQSRKSPSLLYMERGDEGRRYDDDGYKIKELYEPSAVAETVQVS